VVQLYVTDPSASVRRPVRELKGFDRLHLEPGESGTARMLLDARAFSYWSVRLGRWVVEAGEFVLRVGTSSRQLPHAVTVELDAPSVALPLTRDSTLHEWLADPRGQEVLAAALGNSAAAAGPLADPGMISVIGTMPMSTLASFGMAGFDHSALDELVSQLSR
jgi:beta-glucosidase